MLFQVDMGKIYNQLSHKERDLIGMMLSEGKKAKEIGKILGRSPSTISRELSRNGSLVEGEYYFPNEAQKEARRRLSESRQIDRLKNNKIRRYVVKKLKIGWSPEIISGRLKEKSPDLKISHEAIYQWIYKDAPEQIANLVRKHKRRRKKGQSRKHRKSHIPCRIAIDERPDYINKRKNIGHWESDSAVSRQSKESLHVMAERKSRLAIVSKIKNNKSKDVREVMVKRMSRIPDSAVKSFTYDNGSENVSHVMVNNDLKTKSYFCNPYRSWEKGTVENTIGLIRRFFPKKTDFRYVTEEEIKYVENWLNNRPRKCLAFKTPYEVFKQSVAVTG